MLSKLREIEMLVSLFEQVKKYWGRTMLAVSSIWYTVASITSPIAENIGWMLTIGIIAPLGVLFVALIYKFLTLIFPKIRNIKTYFEFSYQDGGVEDMGKKELKKGNIDYYSYVSVNRDMIDFIVIFEKPIGLTSIKVDSIDKKKPTINNRLNHNKAVSFQMKGIINGKYKLTFND